MAYVFLAFNWAFGMLFLFVGLLMLVVYPLASLFLIAASALLLPPVRKFTHSKTNRVLPGKARAISIFILLIAYGVFIGRAQDRQEQELAAEQAREKAELVARIRQDNIDFFNANREQIISSITKALSDKEYQSVISQSGEYLVVGDKELGEIHAQAQKELAAIQIAENTEKLLAELRRVPTEEHEKNRSLYQKLLDLHPDNDEYRSKIAFYAAKIEQKRQKKIAAQKAEKTEKLLAELQNLPTQEHEKNRNLYQQLLNLHPDNDEYKSKVASYAAKVEEERQKTIAAEARIKKIEMQFSAWDGSHRNLAQIIIESMNDPDSYDHVETVYWDRGDHLVVRITFRGKNAFGGIIRNSVKAKVSLDGQVLQILAED